MGQWTPYDKRTLKMPSRLKGYTEMEALFEALPEDIEPEDCFASGDDEMDRQDCARIREEMEWNSYAWFCAKVTVRLIDAPGISGTSYLGGCNYGSFEDFERGGELDNMIDEAHAECLASAVKAGEILERIK